jgi:hypothetical protein
MLAIILLTGRIMRSEYALPPNLAVKLSAFPPTFSHREPITGLPPGELPQISSLKLMGSEA